MADRFWVGGTGNINDTARWAATSGGAGGQSVPTAADNAYFDGNSSVGAAFTVTINAAFSCRDFIIGNGIVATALTQAMTLTGSSAWNIYGSLFFPATNLTRLYNGGVTFSATTTGHIVTLNGLQLTTSVINFDGAGGGWTLGSAFIGGSVVTVNGGSFNTGNYNVSCTRFSSSTSATRSITLGSSTVTLTPSQAAPVWDTDVTTNLTFSAGTSTIAVTDGNNNPKTFYGGGLTFYNVTMSLLGNQTVYGANTFNNLAFSKSSLGLLFVGFGANQTISGTLTIQSANTNATYRLGLGSSDILGATRTLTCAAVTIGDGVDFRNITIAGAAAPFNASTKLTGNLGGNSGITFPAPKTVYWNLAGSQLWYATAWATTSTGTPAVNNFPLAQDTAVVTEVGAAGTISFDSLPPWAISNLTFDDGISPRLSAVVLNFANSPLLYGDLRLSSGVTLTGTSIAYFVGQKIQNLTSAGRTFPNSLTLDSPGGSLVLQDNVTLDVARTFTLSKGTLSLNNFTLEAGAFDSNVNVARSIAFGATGRIRLSSGGSTILITCNMANVENFTFTGTSNIELTYAGASGARRIEFGWIGGGASEANALNFRVTAGFDSVVTYRASGANYIRNLIFDDAFSGIWGAQTTAASLGFPGTLYGNLRLSPNMSFDLGSAVLFSSATSTQQLTSSGKTIPVGVTKSGAGTLQLQDSLVLAAGQTFTHTAGTVSLNGRSITTPVYNISNSNVRSLIFGSGEIILNGTGTVWDATTATSLTMSPGTGKISIVDTSATGKTFAGGGVLSYPELVIAGDASTSTITLTGSNRFAKLTNARTVAYTVVFPNAQTLVNAWALNGTDGNLVTLSRTGGSGQFTITSGTGGILIAQFVSISNSIFSPGGNGYAVRSTDGGGNTGWVFGPPAFGKFLMFFTP